MKQILLLLWILWANMLWVFGVPSIYLVRLGDWRAGISVPLFLFTLYAGWRLYRRTRRDWRQSSW
jgi:hypothetical protein